MKKTLKTLLVTTGLLGLSFSLAALKPTTAKAAEKLPTQTTKELKDKGTLTIGLEGTFAPYSYRKDGKLTGFEVELGKKIAKEMGLKAKFVPTKWDGLIAGVDTGKFDIVLNNVTITKERQEKYLFSKPYIYSHFALITKKNADLTKLSQIKGQKIAAGTGTDNALVAKKYNADVVPSSDFTTSLDLIKQDRAKGAINSMSAWYAYKKDHSTKGLKATDVSSEEDPAKIGALMAKKNTALQKSVNKALDKLRKDGQLEKLSKKYVGGDITK
ncbi:transporter substrate-binding domain-containing protein [Ligilactobacillus faecis]|uniref:transporter substrate-binding domain-containing protein n=1 Tax=Ligilactobacillus faecis TaxID=762833 RepID=UPI002469BEA2|nr:transporter substrate-binding domain-containing protein [Ligilactobacillus faecis]WGN90052.1 transporter substrate-binding domain-containing protein [Ligilactobacillus faecis]